MSVIVEWYKDAIYNKNDPRTTEWFLMSGPGPIITIIATYLYFSISAGPRYMKGRKPYDLKNVLIIYNFIQVVASVYICYKVLAVGWLNGYSFYCEPVDYSNNPQAVTMAKLTYFYFICKLIELLDTIFFILRKKQRQVSFLHIYHHALMPICSWIGVKYLAGGHSTLLGLLNSFVHIVMYSYYMLSAFGPQIQKYLWWKKYLTIMQLVQFTIIFYHNGQVLFNGCDYPHWAATLLTINASFFIYLFGSFYIKTYWSSSSIANAATNASVRNNKWD